MSLQPLELALAQLDACPPSFDVQPLRTSAFAEIAAFLESHIRSGQPYDFKAVLPNPVWQLFEERLDKALTAIAAVPPRQEGVRLHQWYGSGVIVETGSSRLGFDVIPLRREYGWSDRFDLTTRLAQTLDALLITHRHHDHYEEDLVRAFLRAGKPVYLPASMAATWKPQDNLIPVSDGDEWAWEGHRMRVRHGIHVWRESFEEVPLCLYEWTRPNGAALLYGGDVDYTKPITISDDVRVQAFFLPWRAPNALYESGQNQQVGELSDALAIMLQQVKPTYFFHEHCAELEHVYDGFPASFDLALDLKRACPVLSELLFWGESMDLPDH